MGHQLRATCALIGLPRHLLWKVRFSQCNIRRIVHHGTQSPTILSSKISQHWRLAWNFRVSKSQTKPYHVCLIHICFIVLSCMPYMSCIYIYRYRYHIKGCMYIYIYRYRYYVNAKTEATTANESSKTNGSLALTMFQAQISLSLILYSSWKLKPYFSEKLCASFLSPLKDKAKEPKMWWSLIVLREDPGNEVTWLWVRVAGVSSIGTMRF